MSVKGEKSYKMGRSSTLKGLGHTILGNFREFQHGSNSHRIN